MGSHSITLDHPQNTSRLPSNSAVHHLSFPSTVIILCACVRAQGGALVEVETDFRWGSSLLVSWFETGGASLGIVLSAPPSSSYRC